MVPHIATDSKSTTNSSHNMTNSEMELNSSSSTMNSSGVSLLLEEQHLIHMDEDGNQSNVVFGSQLIDLNSTTPYSDATKVRFA